MSGSWARRDLGASGSKPGDGGSRIAETSTNNEATQGPSAKRQGLVLAEGMERLIFGCVY